MEPDKYRVNTNKTANNKNKANHSIIKQQAGF